MKEWMNDCMLLIYLDEEIDHKFKGTVKRDKYNKIFFFFLF